MLGTLDLVQECERRNDVRSQLQGHVMSLWNLALNIIIAIFMESPFGDQFIPF